MVCAFALSAISDGEEWSNCSEERSVPADNVWIHPHPVVSRFIAAPLVFLDGCRDHLARSAGHACASHAADFALAASGSSPGFDTVLRVDGSSLLFIESMKPWLFIFLVTLVLAGCGQRDPIDRIVRQDSADPSFRGGLSGLIMLPSTASITDITTRALVTVGTGTNITILETRQVQIAYGDEVKIVQPQAIRYTAVLADTDSGKKVVLLQFDDPKNGLPGGWWSGIYDAK